MHKAVTRISAGQRQLPVALKCQPIGLRQYFVNNIDHKPIHRGKPVLPQLAAPLPRYIFLGNMPRNQFHPAPSPYWRQPPCLICLCLQGMGNQRAALSQTISATKSQNAAPDPDPAKADTMPETSRANYPQNRLCRPRRPRSVWSRHRHWRAKRQGVHQARQARAHYHRRRGIFYWARQNHDNRPAHNQSAGQQRMAFSIGTVSIFADKPPQASAYYRHCWRSPD